MKKFIGFVLIAILITVISWAIFGDDVHVKYIKRSTNGFVERIERGEYDTDLNGLVNDVKNFFD